MVLGQLQAPEERPSMPDPLSASVAPRSLMLPWTEFCFSCFFCYTWPVVRRMCSFNNKNPKESISFLNWEDCWNIL